MPTISKASFVIAVPDLKTSAAFYRDVLGFTIHTIPDPGWLFYTSGNCTIMAGECKDAIPPSQLGDHSYFAYLEVDDIDSFHQAVVAAGLDQVAHEESDRLPAESATLPGRAQEDVDARTPVLRIRHLLVLDRACDVPVHLVLSPGARWVAEYYVVERAKELEDGRVEVVLPTRDLAWVVKLVLRLGGEAVVEQPPELAERVRDAARETLARYGTSTREAV